MFFNATNYTAMDVPWVDRHGNEILIVIAKASYQVQEDGSLRAADKARAIRLGDEPYDPEADNGSCRHPSDLCPVKRGTDIVVIGAATSETPVKQMDVAIRFGEATTTLRVHGERHFRQGVAGLSISEAAPFVTMPLVYERAYGGISRDLSEVELANPAGVGVSTSDAELVDTLAPQIEHPLRPHQSSSDHHAPMGCGAIMSHWAPRRDFFGTCDDAWTRDRMPLFPLDFDERYYNVAHPSLQSPEPLPQGSPIAVTGMSAAPLIFGLPRWPLVVRARYDHDSRAIHPAIDTVIVEPAARIVEVVARARMPLGRGKNVLREAQLDSYSLGAEVLQHEGAA